MVGDDDDGHGYGDDDNDMIMITKLRFHACTCFTLASSPLSMDEVYPVV